MFAVFVQMVHYQSFKQNTNGYRVSPASVPSLTLTAHRPLAARGERRTFLVSLVLELCCVELARNWSASHIPLSEEKKNDVLAPLHLFCVLSLSSISSNDTPPPAPPDVLAPSCTGMTTDAQPAPTAPRDGDAGGVCEAAAMSVRLRLRIIVGRRCIESQRAWTSTASTPSRNSTGARDAERCRRMLPALSVNFIRCHTVTTDRKWREKDEKIVHVCNV